MLGSRFLGDPLAGGMPRWKYVCNRFLTGLENLAFGLHLSEYHTGLRAYSRRLLETIPYQLNSDDFVFDQELIAQVVAAGMAGGSARSPSRRATSRRRRSVGFRRSVVYGLSTLRVVARYLLHRLRVRRSPKLRRPTPGRLTPMAQAEPADARPGRAFGIAVSVIVALAPRPCPSTSAAASQVLATASPAWIAVMVVIGFIDVAAAGACAGGCSWPRSRRCRTGGSSATRTSGISPTTSCRRGSASSSGATRSARARASAGRRSSARSSSSASSTRSWSWRIAALAVLVLSVRGIVTSARSCWVLAFVALLVVVARPSGSPPTDCPARSGSRRVARGAAAPRSNWPAGCATGWPSPAGRGRWRARSS